MTRKERKGTKLSTSPQVKWVNSYTEWLTGSLEANSMIEIGNLEVYWGTVWRPTPGKRRRKQDWEDSRAGLWCNCSRDLRCFHKQLRFSEASQREARRQAFAALYKPVTGCRTPEGRGDRTLGEAAPSTEGTPRKRHVCGLSANRRINGLRPQGRISWMRHHTHYQ